MLTGVQSDKIGRSTRRKPRWPVIENISIILQASLSMIQYVPDVYIYIYYEIVHKVHNKKKMKRKKDKHRLGEAMFTRTDNQGVCIDYKHP